MRRSERHIVSFEINPARPPMLSAKRKRELAALAALPDDQIDYSDIPKMPLAVLLRMRRPAKRQMTVRIDADIFRWLESQEARAPNRLNRVLRSAMRAEMSDGSRHAQRRSRTSR